MTPAPGEGAAAFAARFPVVWHVAEAEGLPAILRHGLLPAGAIKARLGLAGSDGANRDRFETLAVGGLPAVLRLQQMPDARLGPTLGPPFAGDPGAWRRHIDGHVFFWAAPARRDAFLRAVARLRRRQWQREEEGPPGAPPPGPPVVLALDTAALLARHGGQARFSRINSGTTFRGGVRARRDADTLRPVALYPGWGPVAELAIQGPVPPPLPLLEPVRNHIILT